MSSKLKALEDLRDQIKQGNVRNSDTSGHQRMFFTSVDGKKVSITDPGALEAVEARIAALAEVSNG